MGSGIDAARPGAPEHAAVLDDFKDQLLLVLLKRLGAMERPVSIPIAEADATGGLLCMMSVDSTAFHFEIRRKQ